MKNSSEEKKTKNSSSHKTKEKKAFCNTYPYWHNDTSILFYFIQVTAQGYEGNMGKRLLHQDEVLISSFGSFCIIHRVVPVAREDFLQHERILKEKENESFC